MSDTKYYCTCCNAVTNLSRRDIEEIGFSPRQPFWEDLFDCVTQYIQTSPHKKDTKELGDLSSELCSDPVFKYLSNEDIGTLFPGKKGHHISYEGEMVVTYKWFKERVLAAWKRRRTPGSTPSAFLTEDFPGHDEVMYRGTFTLEYHHVRGIFVPKKLRLHGDQNNRISSSMRRCACGRPLSHYTGTAEEIVVAMQGSSRAGKTTAMIALEYHLNNTIIGSNSAINIESKLQALDPEDEALIWVARQHRNYGNGHAVVKTQTETKTEHLLYSFRLNLNGSPYVLTIVDMAGEIFDEGETLSDKWQDEYRAIYSICDAVWTFIPYQTLITRANQRVDEKDKQEYDFLTRHREYYCSMGKKAEETYRRELDTWNQVVKNGAGSYPSYGEFLEDIRPGTAPRRDLVEKYACVHEARFLEELGETKDVLRYATPELYRDRLRDIASVRWKNPEERPPHAVILTKSDSLIPLFLEDHEGQWLKERYIYQKGTCDTVMNYCDQTTGHPQLLTGGTDHLLIETAPGQVAVNEAVMNRICRNVRYFFQNRNNHSLDIFGVLNPGHTCMFSLSAYGGKTVKEAEASHSYRSPEPYHVLVPLLWTLAVSDKLPVSYIQTDIHSRTPKEVQKMGTGQVVTEHRVSGLASQDSTIQKNLYCVGDQYHYHEYTFSD